MKINPHNITTLPHIEHDESNDIPLELPTLRDQFAMNAMSAIIIGVSNRKAETDDGEFFDVFYEMVMNEHGRSDYSQITEQAYELADAMMTARK